MGFDKVDLLQQTGYSDGDIVPLFALSPSATESFSTSSTSFSNAPKLINTAVPEFDNLGPITALRVQLSCRLNPGTGETATARLNSGRVGTPSNSEISATTAEFTRSGWADVDIQSGGGTNAIFVELKTDPGNNSTAIDRATAFVGVEL